MISSEANSEGLLALNGISLETHYFLISHKGITLEQFRDKTERFMHAAKVRANNAIDESNPKLTSLEKGYWLAARRRRDREEHLRKQAS